MKEHLLAALVAVASLVLAAGCATIMSGSNQDIQVASQPSGARVSVVDGRGFEVASGQTPVTLSLKRGNGVFTPGRYTVVVEKAGYRGAELPIRGELNAGWYVIGNFFLGGLIGWIIVDPITGAMWNLSPQALSSSLEVAGITDDGTIKVVLAADIDPALLALATPIAIAE